MKIGILTDLTGELGSFGKTWVQSFQLAAEEINRDGGLPGGAKIQTIVEDEKTDPAVALQLARKMIDVQGVSAIVGPSSGAMIALVPLAHRSKVPIISEAAGDITLNKLGGDFIYRTVASDNADGLAAAKFLVDQNATKAVVVFQNEASPASIGTTFQQSFQTKGGQVLATVPINPGQTSYQAEVAKALGPKPEWIFCACGQQSGAVFLKQAHDAGYSGHWLVSADLVVPEEIKAVGASIMEGDYGEESSPDTTLAPYKAFADAYKAKYGEDPGFFAANAYDAMILVGLAMVKANSTTGAAINGALRSVANPPGQTVTSFAEGVKALKAGQDINYEGASGPVDFDSSGTVSGSYAIFQVQNGQWQQVKFYPASVFTTAS